MGAYDALIGVPVQGQPISSGGYGIPVRDAIIDLDARVSVREAAEALPAAVSAAGGSGNSVTAAINTWQTITPNGAAVAITNPSTTFDLMCLVFFGCWLSIATSGDVRMGINVTGGVTSDPDPGSNSPVGFGLLPLTSSSSAQGQMGMFQLLIPAGAGAVTLTAQARRSVANAATANYPSINVIPWRYQ